MIATEINTVKGALTLLRDSQLSPSTEEHCKILSIKISELMARSSVEISRELVLKGIIAGLLHETFKSHEFKVVETSRFDAFSYLVNRGWDNDICTAIFCYSLLDKSNPELATQYFELRDNASTEQRILIDFLTIADHLVDSNGSIVRLDEFVESKWQCKTKDEQKSIIESIESIMNKYGIVEVIF